MDSQQITREQAKQLHDAIAPTLGYLSRLIERMEKRRFPRTDPLFKIVFETREKMQQQTMTLHYLSCNGTGRSPRE